MYVKFSKTRDVKTPQKANFGDAIDFFIPNNIHLDSDAIKGSCKDHNEFTIEMAEDPESCHILIPPHTNCVIPTGIKVEVPVGYALVMLNKSGVAVKHELVIGACLIDHGYSGEIHLDLHNMSNTTKGVSPGQKIAQGHLIPVSHAGLIEVPEDELYQDTALVSSRGAGKMGSTGEK